MKKFLSLVLALVMTMSLVTVSAGAKDFTDNDTITYSEAVNVMSEVGVIDGYTDGSFQPTTNLTRGAAAKIICNLILGPTTAAALGADTAPYSDVPTTNVFAGYIAYCQKEGIISGYADGTFKPSAPLTGYAFMKMLLGALGYESDREGYTGANWSVNVAKQAIAIGLNKGNDEFTGQAYVNREEAMLYAFNTLQATMVEYEQNTSIVVNGDTQVTVQTPAKDKAWGTGTLNDGNIKKDGFVQFAEEYFPKLEKKADTDDFMRPAHTWSYNKQEIGTYVDYDKMVAEYTEAVTGGEVYDLLNATTIKENTLLTYVDGGDNSAKLKKGDLVRNNTEDLAGTGNGVLTQIFLDTDRDEITIASINTYLAKATSTYNTTRETATLNVYQSDATGTTKTVDVDDVPAVADVEKDSFYLVTMSSKNSATKALEVVSIAKPEVLSDSTVTKWSKNDKGLVVDKLTTGGTEYKANVKAYFDADTLEDYNLSLLTDTTYNVYLDANGYIVGVELHEGTANYVFITGYDRFGSYISVKTADAAAIFTDGTMKNITVNVTDTNENITTFKNDSKIASTSKNLYGTWSGADGDEQLNRWFTYTVDADGVYTLKPVERMIATNVSGTKTIDCSNVYLDGDVQNTARVYGNDSSVYITAETGAVDKESKYAITDTNGVYTGVQDVEIEIAEDAKLTDGEIYTVYDKDLYVIASVVVGEARGNVTNYAYILSGAKSESIKDGTYYWDFDAVVNGEIVTLTVESKYPSTITKLSKNAIQELRYTGDYVTEIKNVSYDVTSLSATINAGTDETYYVSSINNTMNLEGRTLYFSGASSVGLTFVKDAKAVVIQDVNGKSTKTAYASVAEAVGALGDADPSNSGLQYKGSIAAVLNTQGVATWIVFNSDTDAGSGAGKPTYDTNAEFVAISGNKVQYYIENPSTNLTGDPIDNIYALLVAGGYKNVSYNATAGGTWSYTTPNGTPVSGMTLSLERVVYIKVGNVNQIVPVTTTVGTATGVTANSNSYVKAGSGFVVTTATVVDGASYGTDEYVLYTKGSHVNVGNYNVTYTNVVSADGKDYVKVGDQVTITLTAKADLTTGTIASSVTTQYKVASSGGSDTLVHNQTDSGTTNAYWNAASGNSVDTKLSTGNDGVVYVKAGDTFVVTENGAATSQTPLTGSVVTVTDLSAS